MSLLLSRRSVIAASALGLCASPALASPDRLNFLIVGDWGDPHEDARRAVAAAMGNVAASTAGDFVISTGDNFYDRGVRSVRDPQWHDTYERIYSAPSLQTPWYVVLGNHDYAGDPDAEVAYTHVSPRWRMPARYWRQDMAIAASQTVSFFFLDTTPITRLSGVRDVVPGAVGNARSQMEWFEAELSACTSRWKIVLGHHPILSSGNHGAERTVAAHVRPLLERYGVQAYFNGHDHDLEHLHEGGVDYICSGSGSEARTVSAVPQSRFAYAHTGFAAAQLSAEQLTVTFHDQSGAVVYSTEIPHG